MGYNKLNRLLFKTIVIYKKLSVVLRETRLPLPMYYTDCKFHPSCSDYAVEAINRHGAAKGSLKTIWRILRCSPFSKGGIDIP